ncbi:MAG: protein serine/threonine phosphatase [Bacteroidota bacterium]|nr:protein serine/threonine phosphatase [Bacteroidota bacterium]
MDYFISFDHLGNKIKMSAYDRLSKQIDLLAGANEPALHEAYFNLWENAMLLHGDQFQNVVVRLASLLPESKMSLTWNLLSQGMLLSFHPAKGNAFSALSAAETSFVELHDKSGEGAAQALKVVYYKNNGRLDLAQECVQNAIDNMGDSELYRPFLCIAFYQAGEISHLLNDYQTAIAYYKKGISFAKPSTAIHTRLLIGLANSYKDSNESEKALELFEQALNQIYNANNYILESKIYADMANYYFRKNDFANSISFHEKSIAIRKKQNMANPLSTNYLELAEICLKQNKNDEALNYALLAEKIVTDLNIVIKLSQVYHIISTIYEAMGNLAGALDYYKKYHTKKEEVFSHESSMKIKQLSMRHEIENVQKENELFELKNVTLKEALEEIGSSVRYAKRIQEAILPTIDMIKEKFPQSFVLYRPKDIVAGDFYWMEQIDDTILIAAADCTGHGVPGAMVSVVCSNALNRAVKEFHRLTTGEILDKVTDLVLETFEKSVTEVMDGMDISLLSINKITKTIQWSGAHNPLLYFNDTMHEIPANKQPIGKNDYRKPFTTHYIDYSEGTTFFLFTDGFSDQFGGPDGKKFKYRQLQSTLLKLVNNSQEVQLRTLDQTFTNWKGDLEQIDDVCIIGIRL